jgi:hypothetical protein
VPNAHNPAADLEAALDVLLGVLERLHGPCERFAGVTNQGEDYIHFTATTDSTAVVTIKPHGAGYAVIDNLNGNTALVIGDTPSEAVRRAVEALTP